MSTADPDLSSAYLNDLITRCQRILHALTGVMIGAFVLILLMTTFSTGPFVQVTGRGLYFLILAGAVLSFAAWLVRGRAEGLLGRDPDVAGTLLWLGIWPVPGRRRRGE